MVQKTGAGQAVFLDRDGVLIEDSPNYITRVDQVRLLPGAAEATRELNDVGFKVVVVTNQSAVARGLVTEEGVENIHAYLRRLLAQESGARIDKIYYCPFHPDGTVPQYAKPSDRRKPRPGMLLDAARDLGIDLRRSYLVGDRESDMIAAKEAGCRAIAVLTGLEWRISAYTFGVFGVVVYWAYDPVRKNLIVNWRCVAFLVVCAFVAFCVFDEWHIHDRLNHYRAARDLLRKNPADPEAALNAPYKLISGRRD